MFENKIKLNYSFKYSNKILLPKKLFPVIYVNINKRVSIIYLFDPKNHVN
jgi:hypothetical protein